jgi:hypothetical protein
MTVFVGFMRVLRWQLHIFSRICSDLLVIAHTYSFLPRIYSHLLIFTQNRYQAYLTTIKLYSSESRFCLQTLKFFYSEVRSASTGRRDQFSRQSFRQSFTTVLDLTVSSWQFAGFLRMCVTVGLSHRLHVARWLPCGRCLMYFCWTDIRFVASFDRMDRDPIVQRLRCRPFFPELRTVEFLLRPSWRGHESIPSKASSSRAPERSRWSLGPVVGHRLEGAKSLEGCQRVWHGLKWTSIWSRADLETLSLIILNSQVAVVQGGGIDGCWTVLPKLDYIHFEISRWKCSLSSRQQLVSHRRSASL